MAVNYRKCPNCGLLNAGVRKATGKDKSQYRCRECGHEWTKAEAESHAYEEIIGIRAMVGGYFSGRHEVDLDFFSRKLTWKYRDEYEEKIISPEELVKFKEDLEQTNLLNWRARYEDPTILDGTQWEIELKREKRNLKKYGSNKFPRGWHDFSEAVRTVSGKEFGLPILSQDDLQ